MADNDVANDADSVAYQSVEHGHEEPSEDRAVPPLSSTIRPSPETAGVFPYPPGRGC